MEWCCNVLSHSCTKESLKWKQHTVLSADYCFQTRILKILKVWEVIYKGQFLLKKEIKKKLGVGVIITVILGFFGFFLKLLKYFNKVILSNEIKDQILWFNLKWQGSCDSCLHLKCYNCSLLCITSMALKG